MQKVPADGGRVDQREQRGVTQMTASVMVQRHEPGTVRVANEGPGPARPHGGPGDCGCGRAECHDQFVALAATTDPAVRTALRDRLIEAHLDLAYAIAGRYLRPEPGFDDIRQVAALALVEAVNRFDPRLHTAFSAFAAPTITGSIKRHFRDQRWMLHPPRRIKDLRQRIRATIDLLTQQLRHTPTVTDLAHHLDCTPQEISEALRTDDALRPLSIDAPIRATDGDTTLAAILGSPDAAYTHIDDVETLGPLLAELSERELHVITMRFADNLSQSQIAKQVGCSQMHISRILRAALDRLRYGIQNGPARSGNGGHATPGDATISDATRSNATRSNAARGGGRRGTPRPGRPDGHAQVSPAPPEAQPPTQPASSTPGLHQSDPSAVTSARPAEPALITALIH
jgi:RNA polymerase sigma-B factor